MDKKYCTHNFKGHEGMVTLVRFHPDRKALQLVSVGDDCKLMMWDLRKNACIAKVKDHYSLPTAVAFAATEAGSWYMFTAGRDQVIHVYSLDDRKVSLVNTTPAFEVLEGLEVIGVQGEKVSFVTGGVRGQLRVWTCQSGASGCRVAMSRETSVGKLLGAPFGEYHLFLAMSAFQRCFCTHVNRIGARSLGSSCVAANYVCPSRARFQQRGLCDCGPHFGIR